MQPPPPRPVPEELTRSRDLIVLDGTTFVLSRPDGDLVEGEPSGYFHQDVRHLGRWLLLVDGESLQPVTSAPVDQYSARILLAPRSSNAGYAVRRERFVCEGVHEDLVVENLEHRERRLEVEIRFGSDFADVMEAERRGERRTTPRRTRRRKATVG
jgi:glycogen debranching enzyme